MRPSIYNEEMHSFSTHIQLHNWLKYYKLSHIEHTHNGVHQYLHTVSVCVCVLSLTS